MTTEQRNWIKEAGKVHRVVEALEEGASWYGGDASNVRRIIKGDGGELQSSIGRLLTGSGRTTSYIAGQPWEYIYEALDDAVLSVTLYRGGYFWLTISLGEIVHHRETGAPGQVVSIRHPYHSGTELLQVIWRGDGGFQNVKSKHLDLNNLQLRQFAHITPVAVIRHPPTSKYCESLKELLEIFCATGNPSEHGSTCPLCSQRYKVLQAYAQQQNAHFQAIRKACDSQFTAHFALAELQQIERYIVPKQESQEKLQLRMLNCTQCAFLQTCISQIPNNLVITRLYPIWIDNVALTAYQLNNTLAKSDQELDGLCTERSALISRFPMSPTERLVYMLKQKGAYCINF